MTKSTRTVELLICWEDRTWDDGQYIDIPADTPADQVENVAAAKWCDAFEAEDHDEQVAYIRVAGSELIDLSADIGYTPGCEEQQS